MTWYDSDYSYKKKITVDHLLVAGDETDFPVLVSVTDGDLADTGNGGHVENSNGYDIIFTNSAENAQLKHEIELYTNTNGTLVFWVKISSLSSTVDTDFYIYYGKVGVGADPSTTDTWDSNFVAVYHMDETAGNCIDSTANGNDGTFNGALPTQVASGNKTGFCQNFVTGTSDYIELPVGCFLSGDDFGTIEAIIDYDNIASNNNYVWLQYSSADNRAYLNTYESDFYIYGRSGGAAQWETFAGKNVGAGWNYLAYTMKKDDVSLWVDSVEEYTDIACNMLVGSHDKVRIGTNQTGAGYFDGKIDEYRISDLKRSDNWIGTTYETQSDPAGFMDWGAEETGLLTYEPSDSINISDSIVFKYKLNLSDTLAIEETILFKHFVTLADNITISDNMLSFLKSIVALSDGVNIDDTIAFKHTLNLTDTIDISDIIAFKHLIALADGIGISDVAVLTYIVNLSDSVNISDAVVFKHVVALLDSLSINDVIAFKHLLNLSDNTNISDAVIYKHLVALADSIGISDDPTFKHLLALIDAINIDDSTVFKHSVHLFDSILISDATVISAVLADILSIADNMAFRMSGVCGSLFNLHTATHDVYLPMPDVVGEVGSIKSEIKLFDFWTDERDTVNIGINSEPIVFSGIIFACTDNEEAEMTAIATSFLHIHDISNTHEEVTITGLGDNFDAVYIIKDFKYATIRKSPYAYTWQLTLEYVRAI